MEIVSWNINGIRGGFEELKELVESRRPDFVCLQKVRCDNGREEFSIDGYRELYSPADCGGWSGVMTYAKVGDGGLAMSDLRRVHYPELSRHGHLQVFECNEFYLLNAYVPFSNPSLDGAVEYRKLWDDKFRNCVVELSEQRPLIICGDFNVVHTHKDTCEKRLTQNRGCFFERERDNFNALLADADLVDAFRYLNPEQQAATFYGNFRLSKEGNRIDYFLISRSLLPRLVASEILADFGTRQSVPIMLRVG